MFALEVILGDFGLATFSPIVISSVVATAVSRAFLGDTPAFIVPVYELVSAWELPMYLVLGIFCAVVGVSFTKILYLIEDVFDQIKFPEYLKGIVGGLILGVVSLIFPQILGVGYGAIDMALMQEMAWWLLLFGVVVHYLFPDITASPGAYSIVGMGAVVSATTHGPLAAILILFEMTGSYKIILPVMLACIIATIAGGQLLRHSIYTLKLARRGIDIKAGKEVNVLKSLFVKDVMNSNVETMPEALPLGKMAARISKSKFNSFPVLDDQNQLIGILSFNDYNEAIFDENLKDLVVAKDLATTDLVTISLDDNLWTALEKISSKDFAVLPVVSAQAPNKLAGVVSRRDIIGAYNKAVLKKSLFQ
jgi:CIC family chloride channel protein